MDRKEAILRAVANVERISVPELLSSSRYAPTAHKRKILMMALRYAGYSMEIIGQFIYRNHTTVNYGCESLNESDKLHARQIVESLGYRTYRPPKKNEAMPFYWRKPLPKLKPAEKPKPERVKELVWVPDYKNSICKQVWREI